MTKRLYILAVCSVALLGNIATTASAQELTREERIKILEALKAQDVKWEETTSFETVTLAGKTLTELEKLELPPLSVFLDAVLDHASIKSAQSQIDQATNQLSLQKRNWMNWIKASGSYSYGRYNAISNASDEFTPLFQTTSASVMHNFNVGASVGITLGDILNRKKQLKDYRYNIEQLKYAKEEAIENRRMTVVQAYDEVTVQIATIRAKAETAALYNAEMKITEYKFVQGLMDVEGLAFERARRSGAVVAYEEARVSLHNAIVRLEMLTNVQIIRELSVTKE